MFSGLLHSFTSPLVSHKHPVLINSFFACYFASHWILSETGQKNLSFSKSGHQVISFNYITMGSSLLLSQGSQVQVPIWGVSGFEPQSMVSGFKFQSEFWLGWSSSPSVRVPIWVLAGLKAHPRRSVVSLLRSLHGANINRVYCLWFSVYIDHIFFWPHPWHGEVPGQGSNLYHKLWLKPQQWHHQILNLLHHQRTPCVDHILFDHAPSVGHLGYFHFFLLINSIAMTILVHVSTRNFSGLFT